jgi:hypothetical protein
MQNRRRVLQETIAMNIMEYFKTVKGFGVLATADAEGKVDVAFYSIPHIVEEQIIAFVMRDRLTHRNLQSNPHCAYMFLENGKTHSGMRLYLRKLREEKNSPLIESLDKQNPKINTLHLDESDKYLVYFLVDHVRPLEGDYKK